VSITDTALQNLIISEVGDVNGVLAANMPVIWAKANKWRGVPDLQYLWAKREAVQTVISALRGTALNKQIGDFRIDKSEQVNIMERLSGDLSAQIVEMIKITAAGTPARVGVLAATQMENPIAYQPTDPFSGALNANDAVYRGDPYSRR
jgi:hypothetical protein